MCGEQICEKIFDKFIANLFLKNGNYPTAISSCSCYSCFLGDKECDLVIQSETAVKQLIQVCWDIKDKDTRERELGGIYEAADLTGCKDLIIVTRDSEEEVQDARGIIHIVPAWQWFHER